MSRPPARKIRRTTGRETPPTKPMKLQALSEDQIRQRIKSVPLESRQWVSTIDRLLGELNRRKATRRKS